MARPKGSKNKAKSVKINELEVNAENFDKLNKMKASCQSRMKAIETEIAEIEKTIKTRFGKYVKDEIARLQDMLK